ncbi:MAG: DUF6147 family protein [Hespellia sp.]|nr:DUF6147 family protein [Hespellia sp.]
MRKRIISLIISLVLIFAMSFTTIYPAKAEDAKSVEGSHLTEKEESNGNAILKMRGIYLQTGDCSITSAGRGRIYIYGSTTANYVVDMVVVGVYVEQYNEKTDEWDQVHFVSKEATNNYYVSLGQTLLVERGYYYRVRAAHSAGPKDSLRDTADSATDGIMIK